MKQGNQERKEETQILPSVQAPEAQPEKAPEQKKAQEHYTIKLVPEHGDTVHSVRLSARMLKYGAATLAAGALLFVGAFSYGVYSTMTAKSDATEISELREVNRIQQEQLLQLSKKAYNLQRQMEELTQMEQELRRQTGAPAADDATGSAADDAADGEKHDGQGGPVIAPDVTNVRETLDDLEQRLAKRRASLEQLKQTMRDQQTALVPAAGGLSFGGPSITTPSLWPARGDVSSPYGLRWGGSDFHPGIDIANDMGTPIVATADGTVTTAGWNAGGYGNMVDIDHGNGIMTRYGHAMQVVVVPGQHVRRGQVIAYMGSTGFSTGPHVHYEVRVNGTPVNPVGYL